MFKRDTVWIQVYMLVGFLINYLLAHKKLRDNDCPLCIWIKIKTYGNTAGNLSFFIGTIQKPLGFQISSGIGISMFNSQADNVNEWSWSCAWMLELATRRHTPCLKETPHAQILLRSDVSCRNGVWVLSNLIFQGKPKIQI